MRKGNEEAGFKTPLKKLRTVATPYPNYIHFVATADSGIKSLADIKGKRISGSVRPNLGQSLMCARF